MAVRPILGVAGILWCVLGCGWSRSALAQGTTLLPPAGTQGSPRMSLPLQNPVTQPPGGVQQASNTVPRGDVRSQVIARVNGEPILQEELTSAASFMIEDLKARNVPEHMITQLQKEILTRTLDDMITREAVLQDAAIKVPAPAIARIQDLASKEFDKLIKKDADKLKLKGAEELKEYYQKQGRSLELMRRGYVRQALATEWIRNLAKDRLDQETTRECLVEYYRNNAQEFQKKERVEWQHLFVDVDRYPSVAAAKQQAETVWQLLRNSKTEEEVNKLVEKYADGISKARRGIGEGNFRGEIRPKELERFVWEQPTGGQGPVVETARGFHIFRVVEHTPAEMIPFEKACNDIRKKLEGKIFQEEFTRLSKEMKERAYVEVLTGN